MGYTLDLGRNSRSGAAPESFDTLLIAMDEAGVTMAVAQFIEDKANDVLCNGPGVCDEARALELLANLIRTTKP